MRVSQKLIFDLDPNAIARHLRRWRRQRVEPRLRSARRRTRACPRLSRRRELKGGGGALGTAKDLPSAAAVSASGTTCASAAVATWRSRCRCRRRSFNGLIWAGYGTFTHSDPLEMYGSIFTNHFDASGDTTIHYDKGATKTVEECPPTPTARARAAATARTKRA